MVNGEGRFCIGIEYFDSQKCDYAALNQAQKSLHDMIVKIEKLFWY